MAWTWLKISLALCVYGLLREIRPSEPFVTDFMVHPWRNVTTNDVNRYVFPIGTYSYAAQLVFVFLLTDYFRYKPLIIVSGLSGCLVWSLLIWTRSLLGLQVLEVFYGTYMATEVAYYTYIYATVDRVHYLKVTSHTRAAIMAGRFVAGSLGQLLVYTGAMDYLGLNYLTLAAQIISTLWAFILPAAPTSIYFHRQVSAIADCQFNTVDTNAHFYEAPKCARRESHEEAPDAASDRSGPFLLLWFKLRSAYSNSAVVTWSIWYAMGMCGYLQAISYIQVLWLEIDSSQPVAWNGAVEAVNTLLGAGVSLLAGYVYTDRMSRVTVLGILVVCSLCEGGALVLASQTTLRVVSYVGYSLFYVMYSFTITVASAEVAKHLEDDSYGLIFGINTLAALILQTLLTLCIVSESGLALSVIGQYSVMSGYFFVLAAGYAVSIAVMACRSLNATTAHS